MRAVDVRYQSNRKMIDRICKEGVKFAASTLVVYVLRWLIPRTGIVRYVVIFIGLFAGEIIGEWLFM